MRDIRDIYPRKTSEDYRREIGEEIVDNFGLSQNPLDSLSVWIVFDGAENDA